MINNQIQRTTLTMKEAGNILTVQEREEQMADQTRTVAPRSIAVYEGVMGISQDKGKVPVRAGKRNRKLLKKDDRTK